MTTPEPSIIQQARDELAKWREDSTPGPWRFNSEVPRYVLGSEPFDEVADLVNGHTDARLIIGTSGNPDLLDAIDRILAAADVPPVPITVPVILLAEVLAAAIVAAAERMSA